MFAVITKHPGDTEVLELSTTPTPKPGPDEILVRVHATALNRADLLQRRGKYPPPPGVTDILGLEIAGEVAELGANVTEFKIGQRVFGLVGGGAYAEYCCIDRGVAMIIPDDFSYEEAAAVPEAFLTSNEAIFTLGDLKSGETILFHAGASGVATAGIQMAHYIGATVYATVGSTEKSTMVKKLGAQATINYKEQDFLSEIKNITHDQGVNVIIDFIGADYFERNLKSLAIAGRLICLGLMGGTKTEINLDAVLTKRLQIKGLMMRHRSIQEKREITKRFSQKWLPVLAARKIHPIIDSVFSIKEVRKAHDRMEKNLNSGKIILKMDM